MTTIERRIKKLEKEINSLVEENLSLGAAAYELCCCEQFDEYQAVENIILANDAKIKALEKELETLI